MKLTRHNGRSGKHGTYNPRHNDRRFDVENSEHIDAERARQNIYWDCYRGFTTHEFRENPEQPDFSFEEIERMYYYEHYGGHVEAQNARNEKTRHTERNRTVEDLLKNNKTCPEESIYQIGTMGESVSPDTLFSIVNEFYQEFERRFGSHIHILDWALHLDEGTPHIHERHVFDCENRYGELCPQQEKALEELGIPFDRVDHDPAEDMADCAVISQALGADICKNLLLTPRNRSAFYLLAMPGDKPFVTKELSKQIGSSRLSFATAEDLEQLLGVQPGSASVLGLLNDTEHRVTLVLDRAVAESRWFGCHPCRNTSSLRLRTEDVLEKFLPHTGHVPLVVEL